MSFYNFVGRNCTKERITYSAFIKSNRIIFGSGMRQSINDSYQKAKAEYGIITALPVTKDKDIFKLG